MAWNSPNTYNYQTGTTQSALPVGTIYELEWDGGLGSWAQAYIGTDTTATVPINPQVGREYAFRVKAQSPCGWGAPSHELIVQIKTTPAAVTVLTQIENCSVRISWGTPYNGGLPITNYRIQIATSPST